MLIKKTENKNKSSITLFKVSMIDKHIVSFNRVNFILCFKFVNVTI